MAIGEGKVKNGNRIELIQTNPNGMTFGEITASFL